MTSRAISIGGLCLAAALLFAPIGSAADNPWVGTWKLNVQKSRYTPGPAPQANTQTIEAVDNGLKVTADGVDAQGRNTHNEWMVKFDGTDYAEKPMLDGKPNPAASDTVSATRIDDRTIELTFKRGGRVLNTIRDTISLNGKTRTGASSGTNAQGAGINNITVWEKQ
jgi:hypothetical protein